MTHNCHGCLELAQHSRWHAHFSDRLTLVIIVLQSVLWMSSYARNCAVCTAQALLLC